MTDPVDDVLEQARRYVDEIAAAPAGRWIDDPALTLEELRAAAIARIELVVTAPARPSRWRRFRARLRRR